MNLTVLGTGYVGLVTGACFSEMGHNVYCVDVDETKINRLREGGIPIYEPGLEGIVQNNFQEGRLRFTTSLADAMADSDVYFIAVDTPAGEDGSVDLSHVIEAAREIGRHLEKYAVVVDKSTTPVGTGERIREVVLEELQDRGVDHSFDVVSNPEFLKEGAAVYDFMHPDRIIVGSESERATKVMRTLFADFSRNYEKIMVMGVRDAELTQYVVNAMLATKISFMNEISSLCDRLGVDIENVRHAIGSDRRIGYSFTNPGCGYGGPCFPKSINALTHIAEQRQLFPLVLQSVRQRNLFQKMMLGEKISTRFGKDLSGLTFAVWGLAFKPGTDDMREAPSIVLLHQLIGAGARVLAYDPVAAETARRELPKAWFDEGKLVLTEHQYDALKGVDAMVLVTEWKPFRHPDFDAMKRLMKAPVVFDGRNQYDPERMESMGFDYYAMGRGKQVQPASSSCSL